MAKKANKQQGIDRIKRVQNPKNRIPKKRFLALFEDELLDEVSLEVEVMAIMDEKDSGKKSNPS